MTVLAVVCAAAAVATWLPPRVSLPARRRRPVAFWMPALVLGALAPLRGHTLVLALILTGALLASLALVRRGRARTVADTTRSQVIEVCEAIASELRSGQPPLTALEHSRATWPALEPVVAACRLDADVPGAFRRASTTAGAEALAEVASAWQLAHSLGAGLADTMDRVVDTARARLATHRVVASELASAQATARMIALLPLVMVVLSDGSGADPWHFLLQTTPGLGCLGAGLALGLAGMWWIDRIVARVHAGEL